MSLKFNDKFEDLGSMDDFFSQYGDCSVSIDKIDEPNIKLSIISVEGIEFKILCSTSLSKIIFQNNGFPEGMEKYRVQRITRDDGSKYIRITQSIEIDSTTPDAEYLEATLKGSVSQFRKFDVPKKK